MTNDELAKEIGRQRFARDDDTVSLDEEQWQQILAALRRSERKPSGEMVLVPREPTEEMTRAVWRECNPDVPEPVYFMGSASDVYYGAIYRAILSAAEAEGRKG